MYNKPRHLQTQWPEGGLVGRWGMWSAIGERCHVLCMTCLGVMEGGGVREGRGGA